MHRHGEYKMPARKLVVVDLEIVEARLDRWVVCGGVFHEPDEALEAFDAALTGLPSGTDTAGLARAIEAGLPEGTSRYGVSAEASAISVRRAVDSMPTEEAGQP